MIKQVTEFHRKQGFAVGADLVLASINHHRSNDHLEAVAFYLQKMSELYEQGVCPKSNGIYDHRIMRIHLIMEEFAELIESMAKGDEVKSLDALADLVYVVAGTAVTFGLPLEEAFEEVHRSNMTKEVNAGGDDDKRCRDKGKSYQPPNIHAVISRTRGEK